MMYRFLAALMFFTRLPFWKIVNVPKEYFKDIVGYWVLAGLLTSSVMAGSLWICAQFLPVSVAVIFAITSRLLLTGALHEDGLADFFDGFGGGKSKEQILAIMKDSHIGSYGVISLIIYFAFLSSLLTSLPVELACCAILAGDPICKYIASFITLRLNYVRKEEESKIKVIYNRSTIITILLGLIVSATLMMFWMGYHYFIAAAVSVILFLLFTKFMKRKIGGYSGDCCGALFLLCELVFYLAVVIIYSYSGGRL